MSLTEKSRNELITLCQTLKIKGYSNKKKPELITLIMEAQKASKPQKQDTGKFRQNMKDQFYTNAAVAKACVEAIHAHIPGAEHYRWIEPSAGAGAFLRPLPTGTELIALDIEPAPASVQAKEIAQADFLQWTPPETEKKTIIYGNPPFGRQASTAKAFIAKSASFASVIAFILPLSFTKPSMSRAFDLHYHLVHEKVLEEDAFLLNGEPYNVPCVFQVWERRETLRPVTEKVDAVGFAYVKSTDPYTFALRRVGACAGRCFPNNGNPYSVQSHYFIQLDPEKNMELSQVERTIGMLNAHTFPSNTVGPRSLSKSEVNIVLNPILETVILQRRP